MRPAPVAAADPRGAWGAGPAAGVVATRLARALRAAVLAVAIASGAPAAGAGARAGAGGNAVADAVPRAGANTGTGAGANAGPGTGPGTGTGTSTEPSAALAALRAGGHVLMIRHATTVPGVGDPPGFRRGDCSTQRNLSDAGRDEARRLGARLAAAQVRFAQVLTSSWCRCEETARLAFGRAEAWSPLDSFFDDRSTAGRQGAEVRARVAAWRGPGNLALVTHQVNITGLTGEVLSMGEGIVLAPAPGGFRVVGRLAP